MAEEVDATTRQQVLDLIVEKGPVTASSIAKVLGLTTAAVRRHITLLLAPKRSRNTSRGHLRSVAVDAPRVTTSPPNGHTFTSLMDIPTWRPRPSDTSARLAEKKQSSHLPPHAHARSSGATPRVVRDAGSDPRVRAQARG